MTGRTKTSKNARRKGGKSRQYSGEPAVEDQAQLNAFLDHYGTLKDLKPASLVKYRAGVAQILGWIAAYCCASRTLTHNLLGVNSQTMIRYFDRDLRSVVGGAWSERGAIYLNGKGWSDGWKLHLKGFRKTFQTVLFVHFYHKYNDANVALEWVSKRMKHSSKHITAYHYLQDYEKIQCDRWLQWLETGAAPVQSRLHDWLQ